MCGDGFAATYSLKSDDTFLSSSPSSPSPLGPSLQSIKTTSLFSSASRSSLSSAIDGQEACSTTTLNESESEKPASGSSTSKPNSLDAHRHHLKLLQDARCATALFTGPIKPTSPSRRRRRAHVQDRRSKDDSSSPVPSTRTTKASTACTPRLSAGVTSSARELPPRSSHLSILYQENTDFAMHTLTRPDMYREDSDKPRLGLDVLLHLHDDTDTETESDQTDNNDKRTRPYNVQVMDDNTYRRKHPDEIDIHAWPHSSQNMRSNSRGDDSGPRARTSSALKVPGSTIRYFGDGNEPPPSWNFSTGDQRDRAPAMRTVGASGPKADWNHTAAAGGSTNGSSQPEALRLASCRAGQYEQRWYSPSARLRKAHE